MESGSGCFVCGVNPRPLGDGPLLQRKMSPMFAASLLSVMCAGVRPRAVPARVGRKGQEMAGVPPLPEALPG